MRNDLPRPPAGLSRHCRLLWDWACETTARSPGRMTLLGEALYALTRADKCRKLVDKQGPTTTTAATGATHVHPLLKAEREFRAQFLRCWTALGLDYDENIDSAAAIERADRPPTPAEEFFEDLDGEDDEDEADEEAEE